MICNHISSHIQLHHRTNQAIPNFVWNVEKCEKAWVWGYMTSKFILWNFLHWIAGPLSYAQVAKSTLPEVKRQEIPRSLAPTSSKHWSSGPSNNNTSQKCIYVYTKIGLLGIMKMMGGSTLSSWPSKVVMVISSWWGPGPKRLVLIAKLDAPNTDNNNN